ncbi:MATE family efflux transporter [Candidatus Kapabacteria bacterium]|nr:MATE family efflux transporter [Candidatus Kapabacteria bacterium]
MSKSTSVNLLSGNIHSSFRQLALPLAFSFLLYQMNGIVDKYWISFLGDKEIAAIGVSEQMRLMVFTLGIGFAIGTGVVVARRIGEGKHEEANHTANQAIVTMFFYAIAICLLFYFNMRNLLDLFGFTGEIQDYSVNYLKGILWGIPFNFLIFQTNAIIRSTGNTKYAMIIISLTILINAVLSPLLIFDFIFEGGLGAFGAGIATSIAQISGLMISIILISKGYTNLNFKFKGFKLDLSLIKRITLRGIPSTLQYLSLFFNRMGMFVVANMIGVETVTSYTLGLSFDLFVFMPIFGAGVAMEIIAGQNRGANKIDRIFKYFYSGLLQVSVIIIPMVVGAYFYSDLFSKIFTNDPNIILQTSEYIAITSLSYIFFGIGIFCTRVVSGAGDTWMSFIMYSSVLFIIQLPLSYILVKYYDFGFAGVYWGVFISYVLFAIIGLILLYSKRWLRIKL